MILRCCQRHEELWLESTCGMRFGNSALERFRRYRIAVVGAGVAGITAAHLLARRHDVSLLERNDYLGGHTNTVVLQDGPDSGTAIDTGFIVCNDRTYPRFHRLLADLGVGVHTSDMSFGFFCEATGLAYSSRGLNSLFAQRTNLLRPAHWRMLADVVRFHRVAARDLDDDRVNGQTLGEYLALRRFSRPFQERYLLPMGAAIWSSPRDQMLEYPAQSFLQFFRNHGLLTVDRHPQWQTVIGGASTYVRAFQQRFPGRIETNVSLEHIRRESDKVVLRRRNGREETFDRVVLAAHANQSLALLADPSPDEARLLGAWRYQPNVVVLHTDEGVLAGNRLARASWNYVRERDDDGRRPVSVTYVMNRLQGLRTRRTYCVTLNRRRLIPDEHVLREFVYTHPLYDRRALASQNELPLLNGVRNTYFCGSYFGYGFHEDAVASGERVAELLGAGGA